MAGDKEETGHFQTEAKAGDLRLQSDLPGRHLLQRDGGDVLTNQSLADLDFVQL